MQVSDTTTRAFAVLGAAAAVTLAARGARVLWLRAQISLGPVHVRRWQGQWALVTGGSEGIGKAIAASLLRHGMHVVIVSRSLEKLHAALAELKAAHPGVEVRAIACDVGKPEEVRKLLTKLAPTPITCLVANAGGGGGRGFTPYVDQTDAGEAEVRALNGTHCYMLVRGLLPGMMARGEGAVIGISSIMSKCGGLAAAYAAEKASINVLMESLDVELNITGHSGIIAQSMVIGGVLTPATLKLRCPELLNASHTEVAAALEALKPSTRTMMSAPAADVGEAIVRSIGKGGPIVTPYWRHWLLETLVLDPWWPPSLQRAVKRMLTKRLLLRLTDLRKAD